LDSLTAAALAEILAARPNTDHCCNAKIAHTSDIPEVPVLRFRRASDRSCPAAQAMKCLSHPAIADRWSAPFSRRCRTGRCTRHRIL